MSKRAVAGGGGGNCGTDGAHGESLSFFLCCFE